MIEFLEKVTVEPDRVTPEDVQPLRDVGLSDRAIEEALYVSFLFNTLDRLADALDFPVPTKRELEPAARMLLRHGYGRLAESISAGRARARRG